MSGRSDFGNARMAGPGDVILMAMYSQKFKVDVLIRGERRACPVEWLDQFCMRNFTNSADFDDTLPVGEGRLEASFRRDAGAVCGGVGGVADATGQGRGAAG